MTSIRAFSQDYCKIPAKMLNIFSPRAPFSRLDLELKKEVDSWTWVWFHRFFFFHPPFHPFLDSLKRLPRSANFRARDSSLENSSVDLFPSFVPNDRLESNFSRWNSRQKIVGRWRLQRMKIDDTLKIFVSKSYLHGTDCLLFIPRK